MLGDLAPVVMFAYRRPEHLRRTLEALAASPEASSTMLTVFCDGSKGPDDALAVSQVRACARATGGFASVDVIERDENLGLAASVIDGVSRMLQVHDRVIVLEDDMVVSLDFLRYMNTALDIYRDDPAVISIHGYMYPTNEALPQSFFLRGADCWGWATWRRGWELFRADGTQLLAELEGRGLETEFDFGGAFPYTQMLREQIAERIDSWAIRWYASAFLAERVTLYPGRSLVENIGLDGSGTHSRGGRGLTTSAEPLGPLARIDPVENLLARETVARAFRAQTSRSGRWLRRLRPGARG